MSQWHSPGGSGEQAIQEWCAHGALDGCRVVAGGIALRCEHGGSAGGLHHRAGAERAVLLRVDRRSGWSQAGVGGQYRWPAQHLDRRTRRQRILLAPVHALRRRRWPGVERTCVAARCKRHRVHARQLGPRRRTPGAESGMVSDGRKTTSVDRGPGRHRIDIRPRVCWAKVTTPRSRPTAKPLPISTRARCGPRAWPPTMPSRSSCL